MPTIIMGILLDGIFLFNFIGDDRSMDLIELPYDFDAFATLLGLEVMPPLHPYKIDSHSSDTYTDSDDDPNKHLYCMDKVTVVPNYTVACNPPSVWSITAHAHVLYTSNTSLSFFDLPDNVTIVSYFNPMHRSFCVKLAHDRICGSIRMCDKIMDDTRYFSREYLKTHDGKMYGKYRGRYIDHDIFFPDGGVGRFDDGSNCMKKCDVPTSPVKVGRMTDLSNGAKILNVDNYMGLLEDSDDPPLTLSKLIKYIIEQDSTIEGRQSQGLPPKPIEIHVFTCNYVPNNNPLKRTVFDWFRDNRIPPGAASTAEGPGDKYPYLDVLDSSDTPHPNWSLESHRQFLDTVNRTCGCKYEPEDPNVDVRGCDHSDFEANTLLYLEDLNDNGEGYPYAHLDTTSPIECRLACSPGSVQVQTDDTVPYGTCSNRGSSVDTDIDHQFKDAHDKPVNITCIPEGEPVGRGERAGGRGCAADTRV